MEEVWVEVSVEGGEGGILHTHAHIIHTNTRVGRSSCTSCNVDNVHQQEHT